jgi:EpsI family protein
VSSERTTIAAQGEGIPVNRYVIQKGLDRQVVLYWYQGRGRVVANEYMNKLLLMVDAARLRRTDGALVRLIAPVVTTAETATADVSGFAAVLLPRLAVHLP